MRVAILTHAHPASTGWYFVRAAHADGDEVVTIVTEADARALHRDDLILVVDPFYSPWPQWLGDVRCRTATYLIDVHQNLALRACGARFFDYAFTAQKDYVSRLGHPTALWLPLAGEPETHYNPSRVREIDVGFVGKLGPDGSARKATLLEVLSQFPTNDYLKSYTPKEMGDAYSSSKVVFNKSINGDLNMRVFEAWASGALLVTDRIANGLDEIATEGVHYLGYDTNEEAVDQIRRHLTDERCRVEIAAAGKANLDAKHTYLHRWRAMKDAIASMPDARAPVRTQSRAIAHRWNSELLASTGAPLAEVFGLLRRPGLNPQSIRNAVIALARFISRSLRQRMPQKKVAR